LKYLVGYEKSGLLPEGVRECPPSIRGTPCAVCDNLGSFQVNFFEEALNGMGWLSFRGFFWSFSGFILDWLGWPRGSPNSWDSQVIRKVILSKTVGGCIAIFWCLALQKEEPYYIGQPLIEAALF
jgi:hypothetical protein